MDLANWAAAAEQARPCTIVGADGEPLTHNGEPVTITIHGRDSSIFIEKNDDLSRRYQGRTSISPVAARGLAADLLAAVTVGWRGIVIDGAEVPFSERAARDLYLRFPMIRDQVDLFAGTRTNYYVAAATDAAPRAKRAA